MRGQVIPGGKSRAANFAIWWDGDRLRELLDGDRITKWDWQAGREVPLLQPDGTMSNNGTRKNPSLAANIVGNWREELIVRSADGRERRIYATPHGTQERHATLMHDPLYRLGVAWQNSAYNQPLHLSFSLSADRPNRKHPFRRGAGTAARTWPPRQQIRPLTAAIPAHLPHRSPLMLPHGRSCLALEKYKGSDSGWLNNFATIGSSY